MHVKLGNVTYEKRKEKKPAPSSSFQHCNFGGGCNLNLKGREMVWYLSLFMQMFLRKIRSCLNLIVTDVRVWLV